jgi:CrcB protein
MIMAVLLVVLVAVCGGLGAAARLLVDVGVRRRERTFPAGTMVINITGSLLLGVLAGWAASGLPAAVQDVAGTGFLGGYTTFSSACVEVVRLTREGRIVAAFVHAAGTLVLGTAAAAGGWAIGHLL